MPGPFGKYCHGCPNTSRGLSGSWYSETYRKSFAHSMMCWFLRRLTDTSSNSTEVHLCPITSPELRSHLQPRYIRMMLIPLWTTLPRFAISRTPRGSYCQTHRSCLCSWRSTIRSLSRPENSQRIWRNHGSLRQLSRLHWRVSHPLHWMTTQSESCSNVRCRVKNSHCLTLLNVLICKLSQWIPSYPPVFTQS